MEVDGIFEKELKERNIPYTKIQDKLYDIKIGDNLLSISIYNLQQKYLRDSDSGLVKRFVNNILQPIADLPDWDQLKDGIYPSLEPSDYKFLDEVIHKKLADTTVVILAYYDTKANKIRFLSEVELQKLGIDSEKVWKHAYANIDKIMSEAKISFIDIDGEMLGMIEVQEPYKASLILSRKLKDKVSKELGWTIYAVAPARDFVYLFSKDGGLVNRVGNVVMSEYKNSAYPISTDVWELSDSKQIAIGAFPTE